MTIKKEELVKALGEAGFNQSALDLQNWDIMDARAKELSKGLSEARARKINDEVKVESNDFLDHWESKTKHPKEPTAGMPEGKKSGQKSTPTGFKLKMVKGEDKETPLQKSKVQGNVAKCKDCKKPLLVGSKDANPVAIYYTNKKTGAKTSGSTKQHVCTNCLSGDMKKGEEPPRLKNLRNKARAADESGNSKLNQRAAEIKQDNKSSSVDLEQKVRKRYKLTKSELVKALGEAGYYQSALDLQNWDIMDERAEELSKANTLDYGKMNKPTNTEKNPANTLDYKKLNTADVGAEKAAREAKNKARQDTMIGGNVEKEKANIELARRREINQGTPRTALDTIKSKRK